MISQTKALAASAILLCLGLTLILTDSLSTVKVISRRTSWNKSTGYRQCPNSRLYGNRVSIFRLFAGSDFSSHPYSVYYGTSGSTAQQNFGQNDDINDVYGYGPDGGPEPERFDSRKHNQNRNLQSMQAIPLFDGRRGATVFGRKYNEERPQQFYQYPRMEDERDMMYHDDRFMEDRHVMDQMDSLMHERDHLRRQLDAVVNDNIHLQNQNNMNGVGPQAMPAQAQGQNQYYHENDYMPEQQVPQNQMHAGQDPSTRSVVDSVMDELKNMQRTVQAFEAQHYQGQENGGENTPASVETIKSELKNMEQVLQNLEQEKASSYPYSNGQDATTVGATTTDYTDLNGGESSVSQQQQPKTESISSPNGSSMSEHASHIFNGEYEVVIKAELKKKSFEGTHDPVEKQIDVNADSTRESPTISNYI